MGVKLLPVVDSLDAVPEFLRDKYEARDGKHYLAQEVEIETAETLTGLKNGLESEREKAKQLKDALKKFEGLDPEAARKALTQLQAQENDKLLTQGEYEKLRQKLVDDHTKELGATTEKLTKREQQIRQVLRTNAATSAIAAARGKLKPLLPHVLGVLEPHEDEDSGEWVVKVMDGKSVKRNPKTGQDMTVEEYVQSLREVDDFKALFDGSGASGAGAGGSGSGGRSGGKVNVTREEMLNPARYRQLAKEAGEAGKTVMEYVNITG